MAVFEFAKLQALQTSSANQSTTDESYGLACRVANPLKRALEEAPFFERLAPAGKHVVRTIHGSVDLYGDTAPGDFEFYLGRCGATPRHLFQRFESHLVERHHVGGLVAVTCRTEVVARWESAAIRVLQALRARNRLCVANVLCHGGGRIPATDRSAIYLTWRILPSTRPVTPAVRSDIASIASEVAAAMAGDVTRDSIARALDPITRPRWDREDLNWARGHRD